MVLEQGLRAYNLDTTTKQGERDKPEVVGVF